MIQNIGFVTIAIANRGCLLNKLKVKLINMYKNQHKII